MLENDIWNEIISNLELPQYHQLIHPRFTTPNYLTNLTNSWSWQALTHNYAQFRYTQATISEPSLNELLRNFTQIFRFTEIS